MNAKRSGQKVGHFILYREPHYGCRRFRLYQTTLSTLSRFPCQIRMACSLLRIQDKLLSLSVLSITAEFLWAQMAQT